MSKYIKSTELHLFYGQQVHVIYAAKSEMVIQENGEIAFTKDQKVTPSVTLISFNPNSKEVEIRRPGSTATEWIRPTQVWLV